MNTANEPATHAFQASLLRLGQFLVNEGYVDTAAIVEALDLQKKRTLPIGKLALQSNLLTMKQVFAILNAQIDTPKRFGEIAVALDMLKPETVDDLLQTQRKLRPPLGELLIELGRIERPALDAALRHFSGTDLKN